MLALKRAGLVSTFRTVIHSARFHEKIYLCSPEADQSAYCPRRRDRTGSFQSYHTDTKQIFKWLYSQVHFIYRVCSISLPGSTPVCCIFFFQDERVQIITQVRPGKKNPPHTGVDPGKVNERTQYFFLFIHIMHSFKQYSW